MHFGTGALGCVLIFCALPLLALGSPLVAVAALGLGAGYVAWLALGRDEDEDRYLDELEEEEAFLERDHGRW